MGSRIIVSDSQESVHFLRYKSNVSLRFFLIFRELLLEIERFFGVNNS